MQTRPALLALFTTLLMLVVLPSRAQFVDWPPVPQVWDIFEFDSTFVLGAHTIYDPDTAKYALHMSFSQEYQNGAASIKKKITNPSGWLEVFGGYRYNRANQIGFKFIFLLDQLPIWVYDARSLDAWYERVSINQLSTYTFATPIDKKWYPEDTVWRTRTYLGPNPERPQSFFNYLTVLAPKASIPSDTAGTVLMAGDARFMRMVFSEANQDQFDRIYHIWTDEQGNPRDSATADSLAAIYDKSKLFDVSVAIRVEGQEEDSWGDLQDTARLAYLNIYVRDTALQGRDAVPVSLDSVWHYGFKYAASYYGGDKVERYVGTWQPVTDSVAVPIESCRCAIYRPLVFDTITKADYLEAAAIPSREVGGNFVELRTEFDPNPYITIRPDQYWNVSDDPGYMDWASWDDRSRAYCQWMFEYRQGLSSTDPLHLPPDAFIRQERGSPYFYPASVEESDVIYRLYSTRRVDLSFLRGRISHRMTSLIDEGVADTLLAEEYNTFRTDDTVNPMLNRIGIADEVMHRRYRSFQHVNSVVQRTMRDSGDTRGVWFNPPENPDLNRISTGDFDSLKTLGGDTNMKALHMTARQAYKLGMGDPVPVYYINPDLMSSYAVDTTFNVRLSDKVDSTFDANDSLIRIDTTAFRSVTRTALWDYRKYTDRIQNVILGAYYDLDGMAAAMHGGGHIPSIARHIKASRFGYRGLSEYSHPVWNVVQTHGDYHHREVENVGSFFKGGGIGTRPPTPEEILVMSWASVACNVNGLIFGDFQDDGATLGIMRGVGDTSVADEYGDLYFWNTTIIRDTLEGMWLGRKSRYEAVREVTNDLYHIDTLIGWRNLLYEQDQMSLHDSRATFATMPMLDTVRTERAARHNFSFSGGTWTFNPSDTFDTREETYMEVTQFYPSTGDSAVADNDGRYLLFVNRRTYPIDTLTYSSTAIAQLDANATYTGTSSTTGFGAIDVRRPVVVLKNSTSTIADSMVVEKISRHGVWIDTVAVGDELALDWIRPGRGELYRITPIQSRASYAATAYNNSVHAENTSTDEVEKDRLVVIERDSAVWLRRFHSTTGWSDEVLVSSAGDTVRDPQIGSRIAHATTPAIATVRNDSATLIVWQRTDASTLFARVRGLYIPGPPTSANLANATQLTLSTQRTMHRPWMTMNPAVVGIDSGWVIAYGSPSDGIEVVSLRNNASPSTATDLSNKITVKAATALFDPALPPVALNPICKFPTLAYVSNLDTNGRHVHMAWQQGQDSALNGMAAGPFIMYSEFGVDFSGTGKPTFPLVGPVEHVSQGLPGCMFLHPSIAVDSTRIGVAFESRLLKLSAPGGMFQYLMGEVSTTTLRFRDSSFIGGGGGVARPWMTTPYYWGDDTTRNLYPSLVQFPARRRDSLLFDPAGGLVWFDENSTPDHGRTAQTMYRYGDKASVELPSGIYPTMMNAPYYGAPPLGGAGVLYRGDTTTAVEGENAWGEDRTWYSTNLLMAETGAGFTGAFAARPKSSGIYGGFTIGNWYINNDHECDFEAVGAGIVHHHERDDDFEGTTPKGMPPSFFEQPESGNTWVETVDDVVRISRTGTFPAPDNSVEVQIYVGRTPNITSWLNLYPFDSAMGSYADVKVIPELVRASDDVVLWRSDTISARDMTTDHVDMNLEVPVDQYTTPGEPVYIHVRAVPTEGLGYDLSTGFLFLEGSAPPPAPKPVPEHRRDNEAEVKDAGLAVMVIPNPAKTKAEVHVTVDRAGTVELTLYTVLGTRVRVLPKLETGGPGSHAIVVDLDGLPDGTYLVRAVSGGRSTVERFTVRR